MTPAVILLLVGVFCLFFPLGVYIVGLQLIKKWSQIQAKQWEKREAFYSKLMDKAKAQFRTSVQGAPERLSRVAWDFIKRLETEHVTPEIMDE